MFRIVVLPLLLGTSFAGCIEPWDSWNCRDDPFGKFASEFTLRAHSGCRSFFFDFQVLDPEALFVEGSEVRVRFVSLYGGNFSVGIAHSENLTLLRGVPRHNFSVPSTEDVHQLDVELRAIGPGPHVVRGWVRSDPSNMSYQREDHAAQYEINRTSRGVDITPNQGCLPLQCGRMQAEITVNATATDPSHVEATINSSTGFLGVVGWGENSLWPNATTHIDLRPGESRTFERDVDIPDAFRDGRGGPVFDVTLRIQADPSISSEVWGKSVFFLQQWDTLVVTRRSPPWFLTTSGMEQWGTERATVGQDFRFEAHLNGAYVEDNVSSFPFEVRAFADDGTTMFSPSVWTGRIRWDEAEHEEFYIRADRPGRHEIRLLATVGDYEIKTQYVVYAGNGTDSSP